MKRKHISNRGSKRLFKAVSGTHVKNVAPPPMRGGYRM